MRAYDVDDECLAQLSTQPRQDPVELPGTPDQAMLAYRPLAIVAVSSVLWLGIWQAVAALAG